MASKNVFPAFPLALGSIKLGRLILNTRYPQQDYFDPPSVDPPEFTVNPLQNFEEIRSSARASRFRTRIVSLLSLSFENRSEDLVDFSAAKASTYLLNNSKDWFTHACAKTETKQWLERAIEDEHDVYLVVGYHTLVDARYGEGVSTADMSGIQASVVITGNIPGTGRIDLGSAVDGARKVGHGYKRTFTAAGEQIYAVQYRKIQFKWYSSKKVKNTFLEKNNRWKIYWGVRGEEVDEDDVLEARITDGTDDDDDDGEEAEGDEDDDDDDDDDDEADKEGGSETYVTEDGETEWVF